jgi:hypothetical protein
MTVRTTSDFDYDRDDRTTVAAFGTIAASVIASLYYAGRIGFENPARPIVATLGLSLFITATPFLAWWLSPRRHYDEPQPWWRSQTFFTLVALALSAVAGMAVPLTGVNAVWVLAGIGFAAAIAAVVIWVRRGDPGANLLFVAGTGVFAVWACGVAWSTRYKNPVFWETLEYHANVHHDPLYNISLANNMRTYGVSSTGLDGVPYIPYHFGSGWLNSQWAYLAGTDVLSFYNLGPSVIVIPLFFSAVLLLGIEVKKGWRRAHPAEGRDVPLRTDYAAWLVFLVATVGLIPTSGLDAMGIWNLHALISESYVIGVPVFLLVMSTATVYWRRRKSSQRIGDLVFLLAFAPAMLVVAGFLKVSTMLLLLAAALAVALLGRLFRDWVFALSALLCFGASAITYRLVSVAAQNQGIVPFSFMRFYVEAAWWPYFILVHLFWSWLYIYLRLREEDVNTIGDVRQAALQGRISDVVVVAIVAIAGWLPGEVIDIHGGSAVYFSDVQRWFALSLLMASAGRWLSRSRAADDIPRRSMLTLGGMRLSRLWVAALAIPIGITMILNIRRAPMTALRANLTLRRALFAEAGIAGPVGIRSLANPRILSAGLRRSPDYALISTLRRLDDTPPALKRRTAVFIPQSYTHFWRVWTEADRCSFVPFIVPATSGLALIDGMPPVDCDLTEQYGMTRYKRRTTPQLPADVMPFTLCAKANAKGFSRVVVLDAAAGSGVAVHVLECPVRIATPGSQPVPPGQAAPHAP